MFLVSFIQKYVCTGKKDISFQFVKDVKVVKGSRKPIQIRRLMKWPISHFDRLWWNIF